MSQENTNGETGHFDAYKIITSGEGSTIEHTIDVARLDQLKQDLESPDLVETVDEVIQRLDETADGVAPKDNLPIDAIIGHILVHAFGKAKDEKLARQWYEQYSVSRDEAEGSDHAPTRVERITYSREETGQKLGIAVTDAASLPYSDGPMRAAGEFAPGHDND
ncbi:hypothetical protein FWF48_01555 [Candidatus Saccharibacteria bacterium]|nr:hypothetical protein [Candidatus Saccharibacteria bacterium]